MPAEIIAAIVGALVTAAIGFIAYQYKQRKGNRVIVKMVSQTPQITFSDSVRKKLEIIYDGRKVRDLVLTQFEIFNQGNAIIKPLKLTMSVKLKSNFRVYLGNDVDKGLIPRAGSFTFAELNVSDPQDITVSTMNNETGAFIIERPYLNPKTKYQEEIIKVSVFSDVALDFTVSGGGEDWGSKFISIEDIKIRQTIISAIPSFAVYLLLIAVFFFDFKNLYFVFPPESQYTYIIAFSTVTMLLSVFSVFSRIRRYKRHK